MTSTAASASVSFPVPVPYHAVPERADYVRRWHRDMRRRRREEYLSDKCCVRCGAGYIGILEIHHRDPNQKIDHRHIWHWKEKRRMEELAKCEVLCDTCHKMEQSYTYWLRKGWTGWRGAGRI